MPKKKLKSLRILKANCWKAISLYVRQRGADLFKGTNECYTCLQTFPIKELQAGHYFHNKLDFDPRNLKPQCVRCNHFLRGNLGLYTRRLLKEHGEEWLEQLEKDAREKGNSYSREEILKLTEYFKQNVS